MKPLISIITPVYNVEKFITETIESVLAQTYSNWELVLVDDGSTDDSTRICKEYSLREDRIKYFHKQNGGQASARNLGIKNAKGEYITFLDSDDLYAEDKLEQHFIDLAEKPADFYYGAGYMIYENRTSNKVVEYDWFYGEYSGKDFFKILYHSCSVNINSVLVKKKLFDEIGLFDESPILRGTEDWDLWLRIAIHVKNIYGSPERKVYYRIHDSGIHFQRANMLIGKWRIYEKYDTNKIIQPLERKREYRFIFRELMNCLLTENRANEIENVLKVYFKKDPISFVALNQKVLIHFLPIKAFMWVSKNIIYRVGYRIENISYKLFLND
jgi:glycosyltransferase involved in cell wall biosynthesis